MYVRVKKGQVVAQNYFFGRTSPWRIDGERGKFCQNLPLKIDGQLRKFWQNLPLEK